MFRIKICGITGLEDARCAIEYGADAVGFVFTHLSPRRISKGNASLIINKLPEGVLKVGLFANQDTNEIKEILDTCKVDIIQFHGDEAPDFCNEFPGFKIIRAFRVKDESSLKKARDYKVDAFLLDAFSKDALGGTGRIFDWKIAKDFIKIAEKPVILSGGLGPDNIVEAIKTARPYGVDVSSGIEEKPGKKDHQLMREFIERAKGVLNTTNQ